MATLFIFAGKMFECTVVRASEFRMDVALEWCSEDYSAEEFPRIFQERLEIGVRETV